MIKDFMWWHNFSDAPRQKWLSESHCHFSTGSRALGAVVLKQRWLLLRCVWETVAHMDSRRLVCEQQKASRRSGYDPTITQALILQLQKGKVGPTPKMGCNAAIENLETHNTWIIKHTPQKDCSKRQGMNIWFLIIHSGNQIIFLINLYFTRHKNDAGFSGHCLMKEGEVYIQIQRGCCQHLSLCSVVLYY